MTNLLDGIAIGLVAIGITNLPRLDGHPLLRYAVLTMGMLILWKHR